MASIAPQNRILGISKVYDESREAEYSIRSTLFCIRESFEWNYFHFRFLDRFHLTGRVVIANWQHRLPRYKFHA